MSAPATEPTPSGRARQRGLTAADNQANLNKVFVVVPTCPARPVGGPCRKRGLMLELVHGALYPVLPLRDIVVFPHMIVPLFVGREKSVRALEDVMKDDKQILLVTQKNAAQDDPSTADIYRRRHDRHRAAAAQAARRHGQGAGRGRPARPHHALRRQRGILPGLCRPDRRQDRRTPGDRGAGPHRGRAVRAVHQAQQEDPARGPGLDQPDRRPGQARRHGRLAPRAEDPREAGAAGNRSGRPSAWRRCSA